MRGRLLLSLAGMLVLAGPAWAEHPAECRVAEHLLEIKLSACRQVTRALWRKKHLNILGRRRRLLAIAGSERREERLSGAAAARARRSNLPGVEVKVTTDVKAKRTAAEMVKALPA